MPACIDAQVAASATVVNRLGADLRPKGVGLVDVCLTFPASTEEVTINWVYWHDAMCALEINL